MTRSVIFDTETTGLDPATGDRVIEIACIELMRELPTGETFHALIDPERDVPEEATRVHGYRRDHLHGKPRFAETVDAFLEFIGDSPLIAHNAPFDFGFINAELRRAGRPPLDLGRMIDTLALAKTRFPGLPNSLDSLCRRYNIDLSERTSHNALLDCRLLSDVYVELTGGRQAALVLLDEGGAPMPAIAYQPVSDRLAIRIEVDAATLERHAAFVARIKEPVWLTRAS
ncbi:MAG: DNA polymerase III subunit epsilon [Acetobacteraceae bacterium]|nr:DNA polymerase III subunit epsilon [Acetobacteraceae bacterium]